MKVYIASHFTRKDKEEYFDQKVGGKATNENPVENKGRKIFIPVFYCNLSQPHGYVTRDCLPYYLVIRYLVIFAKYYGMELQ